MNMDEVDGELGDFPTLAKFFVRPLKPGLRPIDPDPMTIVSPVDGLVASAGTIENGTFLQAPGKPSSIDTLLGTTEHDFDSGSYVVIYLSPQDYHRVHSPCAGEVSVLRYLPGRFWPVFSAAARRIKDLFARNERLIFQLESPFGTVVQAMIGAFGVGRISTALHPLVTNTGTPAATHVLAPSPAIEKGTELGRFELGSTVILLLPPGALERWTVGPGDRVWMGQSIAAIHSSTKSR